MSDEARSDTFETSATVGNGVPQFGPADDATARGSEFTAPSRTSIDDVLRQLVELEARSPPPDRAAILADCRWLQSHWIDDTLAPYRSTTVIVYNGGILGAAADPLQLKLALARKFGVHPQRFVIEYIPRAGGF